MGKMLTQEELAGLRMLCKRAIMRLPSVLEFEEYNKRFSALSTDDELIAFAEWLAQLITAYNTKGIDVLNSEPFPYLRKAH